MIKHETYKMPIVVCEDWSEGKRAGIFVDVFASYNKGDAEPPMLMRFECRDAEGAEKLREVLMEETKNLAVVVKDDVEAVTYDYSQEVST